MQESPARRRVRRTRRSASGTGSLDSSSNIQGDADLHEHIASMASPVQLTQGETESSEADPAAEFTPGNRIQEVKGRASNYEREFRLKLLHRMLMRRLPLDAIAEQLKVSVDTVMRDRKELNRRLIEEAKNLDINLLVGDTLGFYNEVGGMAMKAASASKLPMNMRLAAMRTGLSAKNDMHKFLNTAGVYDVLRYRVADDNSGSDIDKLMDLTEQLLTADGVELDGVDVSETMSDMIEDTENLHLVI